VDREIRPAIQESELDLFGENSLTPYLLKWCRAILIASRLKLHDLNR
jgi:hypothetical protein